MTDTSTRKRRADMQALNGRLDDLIRKLSQRGIVRGIGGIFSAKVIKRDYQQDCAQPETPRHIKDQQLFVRRETEEIELGIFLAAKAIVSLSLPYL